jgi:hypothetical protein
MTQEALKQALEALKDVGVLTDREWQAVHKNKANELRQAIAELESQEPVALVIDGVLVKSELPEKYTGHLYTTPPAQPEQEPDYWLGYGLQAHTEKPFENATALFTHPPQPAQERNFCSRCGKRTKDIHTCTPPMEMNT